MLTIRLQRTGKRNAASFRIVVAEKASHVSKKVTEVLGTYSAAKKEFHISNPERLQYWIDQHVEASPTVHNLLVSKGLLKADKVKAFSTPKKPAEVVAPVVPVAAEPTVEVAVEPVAESAPEPVPAEAAPEVAAEAPAEASVEIPTEPQA
jgi:small subunit ribosomal protein S16